MNHSLQGPVSLRSLQRKPILHIWFLESWKPPSAHSEQQLCRVSWSTVDEIYNREPEQIQALRNSVFHLSKDSGVLNILQHEIITQFLPLKFQLSMIFILISSSAFLVWLNQHLCFTSGMTMFQWRMKFIWRIKINFIKNFKQKFLIDSKQVLPGRKPWNKMVCRKLL